MLLHLAVCDDNLDELNNEAALIEELFKEKNIAYDIRKFTSPKALLKSPITYDILFLDIEMDEINGIDLARRISESNDNHLVFFITNYSIYLDKAFDVKAIRYLNKPVDRLRLSSGIDSAVERLESTAKKITVTRLKTKVKVSLEIASIIYITNTGRHTKIFSTNHEVFETEEVFSTVKNMIEKEVNYFCQSHQSFYVNLKYVLNYTKKEVTMRYGEQTYDALMTRRRYKEFDERFFAMANALR